MPWLILAPTDRTGYALADFVPKTDLEEINFDKAGHLAIHIHIIKFAVPATIR